MVECGYRRWVPAAVLLVMIGSLLLAPLLAISQGYCPPDDCLRHCAKAITGRPWSEIVVLAPAYTVDHHQGWHALLGWLHHIGFTKEGLVAFSVTGLFIWSLGLPLLSRRRSEFWLLAVAILFAVSAGSVGRFLLGRPFLLETAVTIFICRYWQQFDRPRWSWRHTLGLLLLVVLSAWCRSTWYLFVLPPACILLAGKPKAAWRTSMVCAVGVVCGALLTGHPLSYGVESTRHLLAASLRDVPSWLLVTEFQPRSIDLATITLVTVVLLVLAQRGQLSRDTLLRSPSFWLMALSALLCFKAVRFWIDFGVPALLVWLSLQLEVLLRDTVVFRDEHGWPRLALVAGAALLLTASLSADIGGRYSRCLLTKTLDAQKDKEWLPEDDGVLYSTSMSVFYQTFYANPEARWRYILAFEPGMMPTQDQAIYRDILMSGSEGTFFRPWILKMTRRDRMIIEGTSSTPAIAGLEWHNVRGAIWSGRLPREGEGTSTNGPNQPLTSVDAGADGTALPGITDPSGAPEE